MPLSGMPDARLHMIDDRSRAVAVIHAALDAGVTLLDTADVYAPSWNTFGHNERLVAEAFRSCGASAEAKAKVVIAKKLASHADQGRPTRHRGKYFLVRNWVKCPKCHHPQMRYHQKR